MARQPVIRLPRSQSSDYQSVISFTVKIVDTSATYQLGHRRRKPYIISRAVYSNEVVVAVFLVG